MCDYFIVGFGCFTIIWFWCISFCLILYLLGYYSRLWKLKLVCGEIDCILLLDSFVDNERKCFLANIEKINDVFCWIALLSSSSGCSLSDAVFVCSFLCLSSSLMSDVSLLLVGCLPLLSYECFYRAFIYKCLVVQMLNFL